MLKLYSIRRKIKVKIARTWRGIAYGIWAMNSRKNNKDLLIVKTAKAFIEDQNVTVFYSPISSKVYAYTENKEIILIFDLYSISITDHKFFFSTNLVDGIGDELTKFASKRIERDMEIIQNIITTNEKNFLKQVYENFTPPEQKE